MDNELLKKVLTENKRIIIPSLGVFLRKEQDGALVFNPFLKKDDGRLSAIVELEYGVSADEAREIIEQYTEKVRTILKAKSKYHIEGLGVLTVDINGVISFVAQTEPNTSSNTEQQTPSPQGVEISPRPISQATAQQRVAQQPNPTPAPSEPGVTSQVNFRAQYSQPSVIPQPIAQPRVSQPAAPATQPQQQPFMQSSGSMSPSASPFSRPAPAPKPVIPGQPAAPQPMARPMVDPLAQTSTPIGTQQQSSRSATPHVPIAGQSNLQGSSARRSSNKAPRAAKGQSKKGDMWLVIAIAAAAIVIVLMVMGIVNSAQLAELSVQ